MALSGLYLTTQINNKQASVAHSEQFSEYGLSIIVKHSLFNESLLIPEKNLIYIKVTSLRILDSGWSLKCMNKSCGHRDYIDRDKQNCLDLL